MKNYQSFLLLILFVAAGVATARAQQVFVANLSGAQEVPAVATAGKGVCRVVLNAAGTQITTNCNYSGLSSSANAAHIHGNGTVGVIAPVLFNFGTVSGTSGTIAPPAFNVTAAQVADLRANKWYANIHTANNGGGEIRGQLHVANATFDDYDGDGRTDPIVFRPTNGVWYGLSSLTGSVTAQPWGLETDSTARNADFDGDGISDYAAVRANQSTGALTTFILQSETRTVRAVQFGNAALGDQIGTGDFDGDGKFDVGVFRNGLWIYIESSSGAVRYFNFGQSGDFPLQGDFDADGKSDFAVVREVSGQFFWYVLQSSNNQLRAVQHGTSPGTILNRSDFDGDGKSDLTIRRTIDGRHFYFTIRSSDGQISTTQWGIPFDILRFGDYDGDGKTDLAVSRSENNNFSWYVLQSTNNQMRNYYWGTAGDR